MITPPNCRLPAAAHTSAGLRPRWVVRLSLDASEVLGTLDDDILISHSFGDVARESGAVKVVTLVNRRRRKLEIEIRVLRIIGVDGLELRKNLLNRSGKYQLRASRGSLNLPLRDDDIEAIDRGLKPRDLGLTGESRSLVQVSKQNFGAKGGNILR